MQSKIKSGAVDEVYVYLLIKILFVDDQSTIIFSEFRTNKLVKF
jgi:hypothetical protein